MNLREQFEKETGNKLINCNTEDAVLKYWIDYSKWLEQRNKEQVEVLSQAKYELNCYVEEFESDREIDTDTTLDVIQNIEEQLEKSGEL